MICQDCPFRSDRPFPLGRDRATEILDSITHDGYFPCHKTTQNGTTFDNSRLCQGAAKFLELNYQGGLRSNRCFRMGLPLKQYTLDSIRNDPAPVYQSSEEYLEGTDFD